MPYHLQGRFFEACDCYVPCPCWFSDSPDEDECTGVFAWQIENGDIDGVDVTGLAVVSASRHGGHRDQPNQLRVALIVDSRATNDQSQALDSAFSGELGGPLGQLARMGGRRSAVERASISFATDRGAHRLDVGKRISVASKAVFGSTARPITINDGAFATLLGSPGVVGKSSKYRLTIDSADIDLDVTGRSTTHGRFAYVHRS
jgi:hypothetical protein